MKKQLLIIGSLILFPAGLSAMSRDHVEDEIQGLINDLAYHTRFNKQLDLIIAAKDQATQAKATQARAAQAQTTQAKAAQGVVLPIGGSAAEEEQRLELIKELEHLSSLNNELARIINQ